MHKIIIIFSLLSLSACDHFEQDKEVALVQAKKDAKTVENNVSEKAVRIADNVRDSIKRTNNKIRDWWITPLPKEGGKHAMPARYCYRVLQDILCYRSQMVGWESKLVGYQGDNAESPKPATMKPLALRVDERSSLPENRASNSKPVFTAMPKEEEKTNDSEKTVPAVVDPAHETLPDSVLSPQL